MARVISILWSTIASVLIIVSSQQAAMADDTEIFFGGSGGSSVKPNILLILDTSSSMVNNKDGTSSTRIDRMKKALTEIIKTSNNVNMGLMRFNKPGGAVLYPVTDIDLPVPDENQGKETARVIDSADDAQELNNGNMIVESSVLSLVTVPATTGSQHVGLRFQDVDVPQGAKITSAKIIFTAAGPSVGTTSLTFNAENVDSSPAFLSSNRNITDRTLTAESVDWNAVPQWMVVGDLQETPDLSGVVQEVVDRSGWCGGNALSFIISGTNASESRFARAYDDNASDAPKLQLEFDVDSIPTGGGCVAKEYSAQISSSTDDVEENSSNKGSIYTTSSDLEIPRDGSDHQVIGLRFGGLNLPQGAKITNAYLEFTADGDSSGASTITITGIAVDDADTFDLDSYDVTSKPSTAASSQWGVSEWSDDQVYRTGDISNIVSELVNRSGWSISSHMAFKISATSGTHRAYSYNGSPGQAVRLVVHAKSLAGSEAKTTRDVLLGVVDDILTGQGTPIVDALYEGALYYKGQDVLYGAYRGEDGLADKYRKNNRVSHAGSYTGGEHIYPEGCSASNLASVDCVDEKITGSPTYVSPITESCQASNIVLLSDGEAQQNYSASKVRAMANISSCEDGGNEACGPELAEYLISKDQSKLSGEQNIKTYTIGFNIADEKDATEYLEKIAEKGNGNFYEAASSAQLVDAFDSIVNSVLQTETTFVTPGVAVNSFNRLNHREEMYFSLFKPDTTPFWHGNLKRYRLGSDGIVYDSKGSAAVDEASGFFKSGSSSWWSVADGSTVKEGGAAGQLSTLSSSRNVYTYLGNMLPPSGVPLTGYALKDGNSSITKELLGIESESDDYRTDLLEWIRGTDVLDVDGDNNKVEARQAFADPLHSTPNVVVYGGTDLSPKSTIFFGDNQGYLHAIDGATGQERFAFMPKELLPVQKTLFENKEAYKHPYGLDGQVSTWVNDVDGDGNIEPGDGDHVYVYIGMRRGGSNYYALDVTNPDSPKWLWGILGDTGDFSELGQTWSQPKKTKVNISGVVRDVLVFAGGYDPQQDDAVTRKEDTSGRAIYMVDAKTGAKLWAGGPSGLAGGFNTTFSEMKYSIPSSVLVLDMNDDGLADRMFVGDVGGQLWRFDVFNGQGAGGLVKGGVIFDASNGIADSNEVHNRRFYHEPDVSTFRRNRERYFSIKIGSGFHAHPLNDTVQDRFYVINDSNVNSAPTNTVGSVVYQKLNESNLYDATDNTIGEGSSGQKTIAQTNLNNANGWYIRLARNGEKALASSLTLQHQTYFTTYEPKPNTSGCSVSAGTARLYHVNTKDATPVKNYDGVGGEAITSLTSSDRELVLKTAAIAPAPVRLRVDGGEAVAVGMEIIKPPENNSVYWRTHWHEE